MDLPRWKAILVDGIPTITPASRLRQDVAYRSMQASLSLPPPPALRSKEQFGYRDDRPRWTYPKPRGQNPEPFDSQFPWHSPPLAFQVVGGGKRHPSEPPFRHHKDDDHLALDNADMLHEHEDDDHLDNADMHEEYF